MGFIPETASLSLASCKQRRNKIHRAPSDEERYNKQHGIFGSNYALSTCGTRVYAGVQHCIIQNDPFKIQIQRVFRIYH
jgi:hypothetical protein